MQMLGPLLLQDQIIIICYLDSFNLKNLPYQYLISLLSL